MYLTVQYFLALPEPGSAWAGVPADFTLQGHSGAVLTELVSQGLLKLRLGVHTVKNIQYSSKCLQELTMKYISNISVDIINNARTFFMNKNFSEGEENMFV